MKIIKKIVLWAVFGILALIAIGLCPSLSSIIAAIIALLIMPIKKWQEFLTKYVKGKVKAVGIAVLSVIMLIAAPEAPAPSDNDVQNTTATNSITTAANVESTDIYTDPSTGSTSEITAPPETGSETAVGTETETAPHTETTAAPKPPVTQPVHTHKFKDATCTEPKVCAECGETDGKASGHAWRDATCTAPKTCSVCKATEGKVKGHSWASATCAAPKICSSCQLTEGTAQGHNWLDATYGSPKRCSVCKETEGSPLPKPGGENYHGQVYTGGEHSKKFHYESECAGKYSHEITWEEVDRRNLGPCGTCVLK